MAKENGRGEWSSSRERFSEAIERIGSIQCRDLRAEIEDRESGTSFNDAKRKLDEGKERPRAIAEQQVVRSRERVVGSSSMRIRSPSPGSIAKERSPQSKILADRDGKSLLQEKQCSTRSRRNTHAGE